MIGRDTKDCLNPYKHHLYRLPDIPKERQIPRYPGESFDALAIFPLFQAAPDDGSLEHHLVRAALWARRSWLLFSDAIDLDIKIGFYVGDTVVDIVFPILHKNGIDIDTEVFLMDETAFEGDPHTHLGKKMAMWVDTQFSDYDWVLQLDCDMFLASVEKTHQLPIFEFFRNHEFVPGAVASYYRKNKTNNRNLEDFHWYRKLDPTKTDEEQQQMWFNLARSFVSNDVLSKYRDSDMTTGEVHGGIYAMPAKHMHANQWEDCQWIAKAGKVLQDDEAVFSLWLSRDLPLFCIHAKMDVPFVTEIHLVKEDRNKSQVYFSHIGHIVDEWFWREDIDSL
ncbi:MAG: hypothetical protein F4118_08400 [Acidimicrobiaceae bacterium]|nr:hypothetical protein [Candidatus Poribacteria bacterium]MYI36438.1 hypothetical protein [Acidimicrobiaceae bacterium]